MLLKSADITKIVVSKYSAEETVDFSKPTYYNFSILQTQKKNLPIDTYTIKLLLNHTIQNRT